MKVTGLEVTGPGRLVSTVQFPSVSARIGNKSDYQQVVPNAGHKGRADGAMQNLSDRNLSRPNSGWQQAEQRRRMSDVR